MSAMERWDEEEFITLMAGSIAEQPMTHELAAQEVIADYRSEQQEMRMEGALWAQQH